MRKTETPLPDLSHREAASPESAEQRMRRALGLADGHGGRSAQPRPEQQPKRLGRPPDPARRSADEAALRKERAARGRAERALQDALATVRDLQTKLGHAELTHREASQAARDTAKGVQAEHRAREARWHEDLAAERAAHTSAKAALHEAARANDQAERTLRTVSATGPASGPQDASAAPSAKASAKSNAEGTRKAKPVPRQPGPQPVKWWLKAANR